jgi:Zn-dependent protease with chaperone function
MTTPATSEYAVCPECSGSLTTDPRFTVWCPSCHWNALPETHRRAPEKEDRLRRRLDRKLEERLFQEAVSGTDLKPRRDGAHYAALLLALPVHLLVLAAIAGGCLGIAYGAWPAWIAAAAAFALAYAGRPRFGSYRRAVRGGAVLTREQAPQLWALADSVADELGTRRATAIVIDRRYNASYARVGLRRQVVLRLGMPLWSSLDEQERVAVLAHEFGHGANGDARRGLWLSAAINAVSEWARILISSEGATRSSGRGLGASIALLVGWITTLLGHLVLLYARLLHWVTRMSSRRAEYLADAFTTRLAGAAGAVGFVEVLRMSSAYESVIHRRRVAGQPVPGQWLRRRAAAAAGSGVAGGAGGAAVAVETEEQPSVSRTYLWTEVQEYVRSVPAEERTRRIVVAELTHSDFDGTHPPSHLRAAFARSRGEAEPAVRLSPQTSAAIDQELQPAGRAIAQALLEG